MIYHLLFTALLLLLTLPISGGLSSQSHPTDAGASVVGTFSGSADVTGTTETEYELTVWSLSGGGVDYGIILDSISLSDATCSNINSLTLSNIIEAISDDAIITGVNGGYPSCNFAAYNQNIKIWVASCATKSGSGCSTAFTACGTGWSYRRYTVSCPGNGSPASISQISGQYSGTCNGGCVKTYVNPMM